MEILTRRVDHCPLNYGHVKASLGGVIDPSLESLEPLSSKVNTYCFRRQRRENETQLCWAAEATRLIRPSRDSLVSPTALACQILISVCLLGRCGVWWGVAEVGQCVQLEFYAWSLHSTQKEVCFPFHRTCVTSLWKRCQMVGEADLLSWMLECLHLEREVLKVQSKENH